MWRCLFIYMADLPKIAHRTGDLTAYNGTIVHCVSSDLHQSAGVARLVCLKRPYNQPLTWGLPGTTKQPQPHLLGSVVVTVNPQDSAQLVCNLVTKLHYYNHGDYSNMRLALRALRYEIQTRQITDLAMPKIGCGLDRLSWPMVLPILKDTLAGLPITVNVFELTP
jgi:O-acetyl-ADP-ribose deacetylase (regulator of RNase III)